MKKVEFDSDDLRGNLRGKLIQFVNARILRGKNFVDDHLWVRNGKIIRAQDVFFGDQLTADIQVDCKGLIVSPGFIDIQLNGGFGMDFSSYSDVVSYKKGVTMVCKRLLAHGVTAFAPTVITSDPQIYKQVLPLLPKRRGGLEGAALLGAHVEGPFISKEKRGCHPVQFVRSFGDHPEKDIKEVYGSLDNLGMLTIAPELEHSEAAIRYLVSEGIVVSLGHSVSSLKDGEKAVAAGASAITHLYNAMISYHHRDPGLIGLLASKMCRETPIHYGIISDGIHTHDSALRIAFKTNSEGLVLITDAIGALGMGDGHHKLGAQNILVQGLLAVLEGTNITAGSVASMPLCVSHLVNAAGCSLEEALVCATAHPATVLGLQEKGVLEVGADADLVLLSDTVEVMATFIGGQLVFKT